MIVEQSIHSDHRRKKAHFCNGGLENLDPNWNACSWTQCKCSSILIFLFPKLSNFTRLFILWLATRKFSKRVLHFWLVSWETENLYGLLRAQILYLLSCYELDWNVKMENLLFIVLRTVSTYTHKLKSFFFFCCEQLYSEELLNSIPLKKSLLQNCILPITIWQPAFI